MILGVDPGLAAFGYALVKPTDTGLLCVQTMGAWRTAKDQRKVLVAEDSVRRARELARNLGGILDAQDVRLVCAEAMSHPRHASSAGKLSMAWGVLVAACEARGLPVVQRSPQEIRKRLVGRSSATKVAVEVALYRLRGVKHDLPTHSREHAFDALAAIVAARETDTFRAAFGGRVPEFLEAPEHNEQQGELRWQ